VIDCQSSWYIQLPFGFKGLNGTHTGVRICKNLSDKFPQKALKQKDSLSPLLLSFTLEYAIKRIYENQEVLELNGANQILAYADDVNIVEENRYKTKQSRNTPMVSQEGEEV